MISVNALIIRFLFDSIPMFSINVIYSVLILLFPVAIGASSSLQQQQRQQQQIEQLSLEQQQSLLDLSLKNVRIDPGVQAKTQTRQLAFYVRQRMSSMSTDLTFVSLRSCDMVAIDVAMIRVDFLAGVDARDGAQRHGQKCRHASIPTSSINNAFAPRSKPCAVRNTFTFSGIVCPTRK
jgi:hypothetical protein